MNIFFTLIFSVQCVNVCNKWNWKSFCFCYGRLGEDDWGIVYKANVLKMLQIFKLWIKWLFKVYKFGVNWIFILFVLDLINRPWEIAYIIFQNYALLPEQVFAFDVLTKCTEIVKLQHNFQLPNFFILIVHFHIKIVSFNNIILMIFTSLSKLWDNLSC